MKRLLTSYILCGLIIFTLAGCGGVSINLNSDANQKEAKQDQNNNETPDTASQNKSSKEQNNDNKSNVKDKTSQNEDKQNQSNDNSPNVTVNVRNDPPPAPQQKEVIIIRDPIPPDLANGGFIFYNSSYTYLTKAQIIKLTNFKLGIARNEIYARHGYIFSLKQFRAYFNSQSWYKPTTTTVTLNSIETYNVDLIKSEEGKRGIRWD